MENMRDRGQEENAVDNRQPVSRLALRSVPTIEVHDNPLAPMMLRRRLNFKMCMEKEVSNAVRICCRSLIVSMLFSFSLRPDWCRHPPSIVRVCLPLPIRILQCRNPRTSGPSVVATMLGTERHSEKEKNIGGGRGRMHSRRRASSLRKHRDIITEPAQTCTLINSVSRSVLESKIGAAMH